MDSIINANTFSNAEISRINLCRLYLQVFFLSDICSGNGKGIMNNYMLGLQSPIRTSKWVWPRQQRPTPKDWKLWNLAIKEVWVKSETHALKAPLGQWYKSSHQTFKFYYDPKIGSVIEVKKKNSFDVYSRTSGRTRNCAMYTYQYTIFRLKPRWVPIAAEHVDYDTIIAEPMIEGIEFIVPSVITNIHQYIQIKYPHLTPLFLHSKFDQNGTTMAHTIAK